MTAQEIRTAIYGGELVELIEKLNSNPTWRSLFGKDSIRLKDRELILRFLALYENASGYERPMEEFLNRFARKHRHGPPKYLKKAEVVFQKTIDQAHNALGASAFRPVRSMNAAVFDSIAVALARRLDHGPITDQSKLRRAFERLSRLEDYVKATSSSTASEGSVTTRLDLATEAFSSVK